jgi:hypothetical protein
MIASMSEWDLVAFAKGLAAYEHTVGGIGSVTALVHVLPLVPDQGREALDWILSHTQSYSYYAHGASSYDELKEASERMARGRSLRQATNAQKEREREQLAKQARAEHATANLYNAVRRCDTNAILALLRAGASTSALTPEGTSLVNYALSMGREDLAELLRSHDAPPDK